LCREENQGPVPVNTSTKSEGQADLLNHVVRHRMISVEESFYTMGGVSLTAGLNRPPLMR
jgi:hypothetical protein